MEYWFGKCLDIKIINQGRELKDFGIEPYVYLTFENCEVSLMPAWEELYSHYTIELISSTIIFPFCCFLTFNSISAFISFKGISPFRFILVRVATT